MKTLDLIMNLCGNFQVSHKDSMKEITKEFIKTTSLEDMIKEIERLDEEIDGIDSNRIFVTKSFKVLSDDIEVIEKLYLQMKGTEEERKAQFMKLSKLATRAKWLCDKTTVKLYIESEGGDYSKLDKI